MIMPWLVEGILMDNPRFFLIWYQYFSYGISGALIASLLAIIMMMNGKLRMFFGNMTFNYKRSKPFFYGAILIGSVAIFLLSPLFILSLRVNSLSQDLLFEVNQSNQYQINQLYSMIKLIPANASAMVPVFVAAHMTTRKCLALTDNYPSWFTPKYVLVDYNPNISLNNSFYVSRSNGGLSLFLYQNYSLYAQNGTAKLYLLKNQSDNRPCI
jgi:hypothetical protein